MAYAGVAGLPPVTGLWAGAAYLVMSTPAETGDSPDTVTMEERVHRLEVQADALAEAIGVLARGLEGGPMAEPRNRHVEEAARRAHELLLLARSVLPDRP